MNSIIWNRDDQRYLDAARSSSGYAPNLGENTLVGIDGVAWMVTTDGHRAHGIRVNGAPPKSASACLVSRSGIIVEIPAEHHQGVPLEGIWCSDYQLHAVDAQRLWDVASARSAKMLARFNLKNPSEPPKAHRSGDKARDGYVYVRAKYIWDALSAIPRRRGRLAETSVSIGVGASSMDAVVISATEEVRMKVPYRRWRSVVMPIMEG